MAKKSLSTLLSRRDPDHEELSEVIKEMQDGSDRVAGIIGATLVENALYHLIKSSLADASNESALFTDVGGPFSNFSSKITSAKALGLAKESTCREMNNIRNIRNQFAHALIRLDFNNDHIKNECLKLREHEILKEVGSIQFNITRLRFELACWDITNELIEKSVSLARAKVDNLERHLALQDLIAAGFQRGAEDVLD